MTVLLYLGESFSKGYVNVRENAMDVSTDLGAFFVGAENPNDGDLQN